MRLIYLFPLFCFATIQYSLAQSNPIVLQNPSFEGVAGEGVQDAWLLKGWYECGFPGESPPDIHPKPGGGAFQVNTLPQHGGTYLGLVARDNNTWEMVTQRLSVPLQAGAVYDFSIQLCRSLTYLSMSRKTNEPVSYTAPIGLRIWGGKSYCDRHELLAASQLVTNSDWEQYDFTLRPSEQLQYLVFEAYYKAQSKGPYNGNLLLDNASDIKLAKPALSLTEADRREFTRPLMGTDFRIVLYHPDSTVALEAAEAAFDRISGIERVFSDYDENSEASRLSDAGKAEVSLEFWAVLDYALWVSERSEGAFDVSVGAVSKLWRRAIRQKEFPGTRDLNQTRATVGWQAINANPRNRKVKLEKEGMRLDFGGIAVGYAIDEAMAILREDYNITTALIDGGGDILLGNAPPGQQGWEIERPDKLVNGELTFRKEQLANTAITSSGDTYRYLEHEGKRYSHIVDPRTGLGLTNRRVATVVAPSCIAADAWATAACVGIKKLLTVDLRQEGIQISILEE